MPEQVYRTCDEIEYIKKIGLHKINEPGSREPSLPPTREERLKRLLNYKSQIRIRRWGPKVDVEELMKTVNALILELSSDTKPV